jgi:hypothetical protein
MFLQSKPGTVVLWASPDEGFKAVAAARDDESSSSPNGPGSPLPFFTLMRERGFEIRDISDAPAVAAVRKRRFVLKKRVFTKTGSGQT